MGIPLKVSGGLYAIAKQEAQATERSITAQVEHWALIGRAVEAVLAHQELLTLKQLGEILTPLFPSVARRQEVHDLLTRIAASTDREPTKPNGSASTSKGLPISGTSPRERIRC
ncbi:MAG: TA system antitoxin ParD family protein [Thermoanaerobaculia bacterium]